ncbi:MAG: DUF1549 and DUF1553 domain-containing protein [Pirellulales bacterium]|nr:DUF1549 and DUF1553 domain-containing protein [Pirellulales bacterium]
MQESRSHQWMRIATLALLVALRGGVAALAEERAPQNATQPAPASGSAQSDADVVGTIDRLIATAWKDAEVSPSDMATDAEWCRRVYLDLVGRIPSLEELQQFAADKAKERRTKLVDRLLESDDYIYHQASVWTVMLIGRTGGTEPRTLVSRDGMQKYLRDSLAANKPYDVMVRELITATGVNKPGEEGFNGAVNFLLDNLDADGVQATAKTSRLFLGLQVQCTQCHNHPFNEWKQNQFWGMNAFFRQTRPLRTREGNDILSVQLVDEDFPGQDRPPRDSIGADGQVHDAVKEAAIYYDTREATLIAAFPTFVDGTEIGHSGYVTDVNRRQELSRLVIESEYLAPAIVNRIWSQYLGYGFTRPVDDMGPHNPASHPELLEFLAVQFQAHGYDLKRLARWVVLSRPYGLSSRGGKGNAVDDPTSGETPLFSRFYLRQMTAEQLYESLLVATAADKATGSNFDERQRVKQQWLAQFTVEFGTDENEEANTFNGTIPQALMMMNGALMRDATACKPGTFLHETATGKLDDDKKVEQLYLAALSRRPKGNEVALASKLLAARKGNVPAAMEDIWWVLLNSNEFILVH